MIDIIFITYNRYPNCIDSLYSLLSTDEDMDYRVHIVNNGSCPKTKEFLSKLSHPKIGSIISNTSNLGISPVVNKFWSESKAEYFGKIDDDIIVPKNWISETMSYIKDAPKNNIGPITCYHWIPEWSKSLDSKKLKIYTVNGKELVRSTHTGGNYIMNRYIYDRVGPTPIHEGLKGGFTSWQFLCDTRKNIIAGYMYPFKFFRQPSFEKAWDRNLKGLDDENTRKWFKEEQRWARVLLEEVKFE